MKVGIVGSRKYTNKNNIRDFVFRLKEELGDDVEIVSGGCKYGADKYAKKYALEFDMKYVEFPASHESYNIHCILPKYKYGKPYATWHYFERNKEIAKYSDKIIAFIPDGIKSNGTMNTIEHAQKMKKKVVILN